MYLFLQYSVEFHKLTCFIMFKIENSRGQMNCNYKILAAIGLTNTQKGMYRIQREIRWKHLLKIQARQFFYVLLIAIQEND